MSDQPFKIVRPDGLMLDDTSALNFQLVSSRNQALLDWWLSGAEDGVLPKSVDFVTLAPFVSSCVLLEVERDPDDFLYRFAGTRVDDFVFKPLTGLRITESPTQAPPSKVWDSCIRVRDEKIPLSGEVPYVGPKKDIVWLEDLMLPLSSDGEKVTSILVGLDFFKAESTEPF